MALDPVHHSRERRGGRRPAMLDADAALRGVLRTQAHGQGSRTEDGVERERSEIVRAAVGRRRSQPCNSGAMLVMNFAEDERESLVAPLSWVGEDREEVAPRRPPVVGCLPRLARPGPARLRRSAGARHRLARAAARARARSETHPRFRPARLSARGEAGFRLRTSTRQRSSSQGATALQPETSPLSKPWRKSSATTNDTGTSTSGVSGSLLCTQSTPL